ncbi:MAG: type II secretion system F family protein [Pseudomonadales bacterium]|nr:type II secretion system F family protein [Pseudomonadales bacterium]
MEFRYQAVDQKGQISEGSMDAKNERDVMRQLEQYQLIPVSIMAQQIEVLQPSKNSGRISQQSRTLVIRELATLLKAGVTLVEAVESIAQTHLDDGTGAAFTKMHTALRAGLNFSTALAESGLELPSYMMQLAAAGEFTGKLAEALDSGAAQMEYQAQIRQDTRNALIYPAILMMSGIAAVLLIFIVVVPKFTSMLNNNQSQLPELSRLVLELGVFVNGHLLELGIGLSALFLLVVSALSNAAVRLRLMETMSLLPGIGLWITDVEMGNWATMLGTLLTNRVPIVKSMELAEQSLRLVSLRHKMQRVGKEVCAGRKLADALQSNRTLSLTGINLIRVGERTSELAPMLKTLATLYETSTRERIKRFLIILEPLSILSIGGVIGVIMAAIMLAVTSMNNVIH